MTKSTTLLAAPKIGWLAGIIFVEYQLAPYKNPDFLIQTSWTIGAKKVRVSLWRRLVAKDLLPRPYVTSPLRPEGRVETQHVPDCDSCTSLSFCLEEGKRKGSNNNNIYSCCLWHFNHSPWLWCPRRFLPLLIPCLSLQSVVLRRTTVSNVLWRQCSCMYCADPHKSLISQRQWKTGFRCLDR